MVARVVNPLSADRCPGILHPVAARDGMLVRIRIPGGEIDAGHLRGFAEAAERYGDGAIDVTALAGVQLRGIHRDDIASVAQIVERIGLLPSADHDRVRNILSNPFAGSDPSELLDPRPFVRALDARLVSEAAFAALPPKFAFAIDGGGIPVPANGADIALTAVRYRGEVAFAATVGGKRAEFGIAPADAVDALIAATHAALSFARAHCAPGWRLAASGEIRRMVIDALGPYGIELRAAVAPANAEQHRIPCGFYPAVDAARVNLVPVVPLGRLRSAQARAIASLAQKTGAGLRLGWWRGIVMADVMRADVAAATAGLLQAGLVLDRSDGFAGIAACAGVAGCTAALADVRSDAIALARAVAALPAREWRVHVAGCGKRCAMRRGASVDLIATESGYDVLVAGAPPRTSLSARDALAHALTAGGSAPDPETR
ncbi:MAG: precorrin-3B synthase [Candidatus Velthaea sp.]